MSSSSKSKRFQNRSYGRLVALQTLYQDELNPGAATAYGDDFIYSELNQLCPTKASDRLDDEEIDDSQVTAIPDGEPDSDVWDVPINEKWSDAPPLLYHELLELVQFVKTLIDGTRERRTEIDQKIADAAQNWSISRMSPIDRNILRMAVYEATFEKTPKAVVISEAIELGKRFGSKDSAAFINGILDKISR